MSWNVDRIGLYLDRYMTDFTVKNYFRRCTSTQVIIFFRLADNSLLDLKYFSFQTCFTSTSWFHLFWRACGRQNFLPWYRFAWEWELSHHRKISCVVFNPRRAWFEIYQQEIFELMVGGSNPDLKDIGIFLPEGLKTIISQVYLSYNSFICMFCRSSSDVLSVCPSPY